MYIISITYCMSLLIIMDRLSPEQRRKNMQNIKSKDTSIECILRSALWNRGIRYYKNYKKLPGKPDIAISKYKIAVFCDSEFFHGKDWDDLEKQLNRGKNSKFWTDKISRNIERDREVDAELNGLGWKVLRFWGKDIKKDTENCIRTIEDAIFERKMEMGNRYEI